jgi:hypothetical protein
MNYEVRITIYRQCTIAGRAAFVEATRRVELPFVPALGLALSFPGGEEEKEGGPDHLWVVRPDQVCWVIDGEFFDVEDSDSRAVVGFETEAQLRDTFAGLGWQITMLSTERGGGGDGKAD